MTARKRATIYTETMKHTGVVIGPVKTVHPVIQLVACPWMYDHRLHGYKVPIQFLADIEAALTADGHRVEARAVPLCG
jgi:hypothetical protein